MKSTYFGLLAEFDGRANLQLAEVCERYFGLGLSQAKRLAAVQGLPVTVYKVRDVDKCPYFVSAAELADHIDSQHAKAKKLREAFNSGLRAAG